MTILTFHRCKQLHLIRPALIRVNNNDRRQTCLVAACMAVSGMHHCQSGFAGPVHTMHASKIHMHATSVCTIGNRSKWQESLSPSSKMHEAFLFFLVAVSH